MTDETNEIICKCGHPIAKHDYYGCRHDGLFSGCSCNKSDITLYRSRLSALQTEVEGRGEMITTLRHALIRRARHAHELHHAALGEFETCPHFYCEEALQVLAATAPVEGGMK